MMETAQSNNNEALLFLKDWEIHAKLLKESFQKQEQEQEDFKYEFYYVPEIEEEEFQNIT